MLSKGIEPRIGLRPQVGVRVDPQLVLSGRLLELAQAELAQAIESELAENPALERIDDDEPIRDDEVMRAIAPSELRPGGEEYERTRSLPLDDREPLDWVGLVPSETSLHDSLLAQMRVALAGRLDELCTYLVGSLDDRGYLTVTREEAALDTASTLEEAEEAIKVLKSCRPAGIGAADLRECLLLQLRRPETPGEALAKRILRDHWDMFVSRRANGLARKLGCEEEELDEAMEALAGLRPHPVDAVAVGRGAVRPDLILSYDEYGWHVVAAGPFAGSLCVSRGYQRAAKSGDVEERRHAKGMVSRAESFLAALESRERLMERIGRVLVQELGGFVATGDAKFLKPYTRARLAATLGVHESSISRATNGKCVQIGTGEIVPFDVFFRPALRVQRMIEEILASENPGRPLSDAAIADLLRDQGVIVARRTVNKYRDRHKMVSSRLRRASAQ